MDVSRLADRERVRRAASVSVISNALLGLFKLATGLISGSMAVVGDALNSFSDLPASLLVLLGIRKAQEPPDPEHPFGHGDLEAVIGLLIAISLVLVAYEFGRYSVLRLLKGEYQSIGIIAIVASLVSISAKIALSRYVLSVARDSHSLALEAQAWDHRADALSSSGVLVGVTAAYLGARVLDPVLALAMAAVIGLVGFKVGRRNIENLIGTLPDTAMTQRIEEIAMAVRGVREVHKIRLHYFGPYAEVDMHVVMDPKMTIEESHAITDRIIERTKAELADIEFVTVHVEPR